MSSPLRAHIDLQALRHNLSRVRECAPASKVLAVIKADAYGHGLVRVARALADAGGFAVARIGEAQALRAAGIATRLLVLSGACSADELEIAGTLGLDIVVQHRFQVELLERARLAAPIRVWLKVDTGMHRLGVEPECAGQLFGRLSACPSVARPLCVMTHLANADSRDDPFTARQIERFDTSAAGLEAEVSLANSAGVLAWPHAHAHWVRPGIMLYGISPFGDSTGVDEGLRPVMTLGTRLISVKRVPKGGAIGYGGAWVCPEDMPVGVAAIGYADGYLRCASPGTPVLVNGRRVALAGRVSMDMITLDLRTHPEARPGDPVMLWGPGLPVEEVARHLGTIPYELVSRVASRVEFVESG